MIEQIRQLVNDDGFLGEYEASLKDILKTGISGEDRLRYFFLMVIMARLCVEELENLDKTGMLKELHQKYEDVVSRQTALMTEIRAHYDILSNIMAAIGPWDTDGAMTSKSASVQTLLGELETGLQHLVEIRKSEDFDRLCRMEVEAAK